MRRVDLNEGFDFDAWQARQAGKPKTQMAGDRVEQLLAEYSRELDLESDAIQYLNNRAIDLRQFNVLAPTGKTRFADAEKILYALEDEGLMKGGIPMPLRRTTPKTQERVFTRFETNKITGEQQLVPYLDPNDLTQAVSIKYGTPIPDKYTQADEYVSEAALKLMGYQVSMPKSNRVADFQVVDSNGESWAFDGMQIEKNKDIPMQVFSYADLKNPDGTPMSALAVKRMLEAERAKGNNIVDVVDSYVDRGQASRTAKVAGKIIRGDHNSGRVLPEEEYDALMMPEYSQSRRNNPIKDQQPARMIIPPQGMWMANVPDAFQAVKSNKGGNIIVPHNKFNPGKHKVNVLMDRNMQQDGQRIFIDLIEQKPELAQLLDEMSMKKRRVN